MPSIRITRELKDQVYFLTLTVKDWHYLFDRHQRFKILEDCFVFCQKNKGLKIYAFVFMLNHLHFIASAQDIASILRDMKTYLSKAFKNNILKNEPNLIKKFNFDGKFQFWGKTNYPKLIISHGFFSQKVNYVHMNPVKKLYVNFPEDWCWSSASKIPTRIKISELEL